MSGKVLGMIPGFKPPEGTVPPPKGFTKLPTPGELHAYMKEWVANRSQLLGELTDPKEGK